MTYKKIVYRMLERDARDWMEKLLKDTGIRVLSTEVEEMENEDIHFTYTVKVILTGNFPGLKFVWVGGTVCDDLGICHSSVFRSREKCDIAWMSVKESRELLGITEFKI